MAATPQFSKVRDAINKGLENLAKWYQKTSDTSAYFICLGKYNFDLYASDITDNNGAALDPNIKVAYTEHQWDKPSFDAGLKKFEEIVSNRWCSAPVLISIFPF